jgi:hypothetical protein
MIVRRGGLVAAATADRERQRGNWGYQEPGQHPSSKVSMHRNGLL